MFDSPPMLGGHNSVNGGTQRRLTADDHYDIPWEFKNRALAAVVGQQLLNKKRETAATEMPKERGAEGGQKDQQQQQIMRKRLSLPQAMCANALGKKLVGNGASGVRAREQQQPHKGHGAVANGKTAPAGTVPANEQFQFIHQPTTSFDLSPPTATALPCLASSSSASSPSCSSSSTFSSSSPEGVPAAAAVSARNGPALPAHHNGGVPQQRQGNEQQRHQQTNVTSEERRRKPAEQQQQQNGGTPSASAVLANNNLQLRNYPMVAMPTSASAKEVIAFCQHRQCPPALEQLDNLVHEGMDRCQSEQLLCPMNIGAHLLRRRPDRNLALSLRAKEGVLHIKLEFHQSQWVLGDGPRFSSVHGMLRAYRRTELPVRGAEQIRLSILLKPSDVPGGLLLL